MILLNFLKDIELYKEDIYIFFHDEDEIQSDLFFTFEALMKKGMSNLFNPLILQKDDPGYKMYEIFPQMWKDDSDQDKPTYVYRRCSLLIKEKLKSLDNDLYSHFKRIDLNCVAFLQKWLRCIFCREFNLDDVYIIWDIILHNEYINQNTEKYSFIYMEYISIAMIFKIRDTLKDADQNECFSTLFKYPEIKDIMEIIKLSQKVETAINERLNGKNSNVYDILGIMKPIESAPTHIFSPHMYNQSGSKTTQNNNNSTNNNTISGNSSKNGFNSVSEEKNTVSNGEGTNKNYTQFDEDEKENINLDSVNHNYSNNNDDIGSQAKSFFNTALNSLSNFGGIIKDQIQNAKDTVIDSFTGNDNFEDNYQQNDNYYNNNSDYNNNYNNNSNYNYNNSDYNNRNSFNNENNMNNNTDNNIKNNVEQNEEIKNQNTNEIKNVSFDSGNELAYNRQDMIDIVNKLKEFDTRYNMFFNDEDKKNFRIIIDYLKAKI